MTQPVQMAERPSRNREQDIQAFLHHVRALVSDAAAQETESILRGISVRFYTASFEDERLVRHHAKDKRWNITLPE